MEEKFILKKERYEFLDLIKAIGIFFVVFYHSYLCNHDILSDNSIFVYANYWFKTILSTCVPLLFFANGALLLNKPLIIKNHISKIIKIITLTVVWGVISLLLLMVIFNQYLSVNDFIKGLYTFKLGWINHLWFMAALVIIYFFLPLIKSAFDHNKSYFNFFFISIFLFTFGNVFITMGANTIEFFVHRNFSWVTGYFSFYNPVNGIRGYSLVYFMLGGLFFKYREYLMKRYFFLQSKVLLILIIFSSMILLMAYGIIESKNTNNLFDVAWDGYDSIFTLVNVLAISVLSLNYKGKLKLGKLIRCISENSLGIYFLHWIISKMLNPYFTKFQIHTNFFATLIYVLIIFLLSLGSALVIKKIPFVKRLISI